MAAVALICMTMTGIVLSSCGDDDSEVVVVRYYYKCQADKLRYITGEEATFKSFSDAVQAAMDATVKNSSHIPSESEVIMCVQAVVDVYNYGVISGTFDLMKSSNGKDYTTVKTFTMQYNPKYLE